MGSFFQARVSLLLHSQASGKIRLFWRGTKLWRKKKRREGSQDKKTPNPRRLESLTYALFWPKLFHSLSFDLKVGPLWSRIRRSQAHLSQECSSLYRQVRNSFFSKAVHRSGRKRKRGAQARGERQCSVCYR